MTVFIAALLLCVAASAFLLLPLWLQRRGTDRRHAVAALTITRLGELEQDYHQGLIDEAGYRQLRLEQERRLLQEADEREGALPQPPRRALLVVCALALPLVALLVYQQLGGWADWDIQQRVERSQALAEAGQDNREALTALAAALEQRLQAVDDDEGRRRFLLARLRLQLGQPDAAATHYRQLVQQFPQDAALNAQYAQALYLALDRKLTPEVLDYANKALALDVDQTTALGVLGIAAFEAGDYATALTHWRRLRGLLAPASANAQVIAQGISRAEAALRDAAGGAADATAGTAAAAVASGPRLEVAVDLDPQLAVPPGATLFVFARAVGGPPMPLAVVRLSQPSLPLQVTLGDAQAMAPGATLSGALAAGSEVEVVARFTASGQVRGEAGDLEGSSGPVRLAPDTRRLALTIDRRL